MLAGDVSGQLDEQALRAQPDVQRVKDLGRVGLIGRDITLAERGHPQVDERFGKIRTAQAAHMRCHVVLISFVVPADLTIA